VQRHCTCGRRAHANILNGSVDADGTLVAAIAYEAIAYDPGKGHRWGHCFIRPDWSPDVFLRHRRILANSDLRWPGPLDLNSGMAMARQYQRGRLFCSSESFARGTGDWSVPSTIVVRARTRSGRSLYWSLAASRLRTVESVRFCIDFIDGAEGKTAVQGNA